MRVAAVVVALVLVLTSCGSSDMATTTVVVDGNRGELTVDPSATMLEVTESTTTSGSTPAVSPDTTLPAQQPTAVEDNGQWVRVPHDPDVFVPAAMTGITSHGGTLVAVGFEVDAVTSMGRPLAWWSVDGIGWQRAEIEADNAELFGVSSANGLAVAVGWSDNAGAIWTSTDGADWTPVTAPKGVFDLAANTSINAVVPYRDGFVAVGQEIVAEATDGLETGYEHDEFSRAVVWVSADGFSWTRIEDPSFGGSGFTQMQDVATNGTTVVAVGRVSLSETRSVPKAWYSEDGRFWQAAPIDDDSDHAFMSTVTSDGRFYSAAGGDLASGRQTGAAWFSDGPSWERDGTMDGVVASRSLFTPNGRIVVGAYSGSLWYLQPAENYPFKPAPSTEIALDPPVNDPAFGDAEWIGDRVVIVGSHYSPADQEIRAAVWHWIPPEPVAPPTVEVPDLLGPGCSAVEHIEPGSQLWDHVAVALFEQEKDRLGLTDQNPPVHIETVVEDGWIALISWFDRTTRPITLWVGEPTDDTWTFTAIWDRFGGSAEEILGALNAAFPDAPEGLRCIDTESFRTQ